MNILHTAAGFHIRELFGRGHNVSGVTTLPPDHSILDAGFSGFLSVVFVYSQISYAQPTVATLSFAFTNDSLSHSGTSVVLANEQRW